MAKLVVDVLEANDLMPKDGHGSANPFVEVEYEGQRQKTSTKLKSLNPSWNEKLVFNIKNPRNLSDHTIEVIVYNDNKHSQHKNFLGRVRVSGASVPASEQEALVQRYPLDKRGIFSHVKGDIALKMYVTHESVIGLHQSDEVTQNRHLHRRRSTGSVASPLRDISSSRFNDEYYNKESHDKNRVRGNEKDVRRFYSMGAANAGNGGVGSDFEKALGVPLGTTVMHSQAQEQKSEYGVVETKPPLAARMGFWGRDKTASTYDMVEPMHFLYVRVVKAMELPVMDVSGSLDPYVEVRIGNYKGVTKHFEKTRNPVWNSVFAFSKERLQSNLIEVTVKDKDVGVDDFVGKILFDVLEVPERVPPDSPLAPQWYKLVDKKGELLKKGDIMLAVWMGTQADEAYPDAWHADAHRVSQDNLTNTQSKVYFSPRLAYLRVQVIAAQDLVPSDSSRQPDTLVRVELGNQGRTTRPCPTKTTNPEWNEELMYVAYEPFDENVVVSVEDKIQPGAVEVIGRVYVPLRDVPHRVDTTKLPDAKWYPLQKPPVTTEEEAKKDRKFASRIYLRIYVDSGYHVLDESTHFSSDFQPAAKQLRKPSIGILEVGILSANNLQPMKAKEGKSTDAYCVARYGNKWVRTRTLLDTLHPRWNEQYTWEVFDSCTVITIAVFDNGHLNGKDDAKDQKIGKVRIRLSTLETDRVYTHAYPLLALTSSGLKKNGELHLAIRFTCTAWVNMVAQYGRPLLPKMHYIQPISIKHVDLLRHLAMTEVAAKLARAEPPLRTEVVEYMLDVDYHMFSLRRSKANFQRLMLLFSGISKVWIWFDDICHWRNPLTTILVHVLFLILVFYPELIMPTFFLYLFAIGLYNYRLRPNVPPHMDAKLSQAENAHPDELDEEFDTFPTSRQTDLVKMRYDRLRTVSGRVQNVTGDLATQGERVLSLLSWRDPRATAIFVMFSLICAVVLYVAPFQFIALLLGLYLLRHHRLRRKLPPVPVNFFKRLPSRSDSLL